MYESQIHQQEVDDEIRQRLESEVLGSRVQVTCSQGSISLKVGHLNESDAKRVIRVLMDALQERLKEGEIWRHRRTQQPSKVIAPGTGGRGVEYLESPNGGVLVVQLQEFLENWERVGDDAWPKKEKVDG